jgi:competence protein ComEA
MGHGPLLILAILGLSALLAGWFMFTRSSGSVERIPTAIREKAAQSAPLVSESSTPVSPESGATGIVIDVAGKVRNPGVFTLPLGSRVVDAIEAAGGMRPGAKPGTLNRARVLVDGEQIYVGNPPGGAAAAAVSAPGAPAGGSLVPLNTANQEQLETLPGVGPVTAQSILAWRASHGSFTKIDELLEVDGIGEKTLAKLAPYVTL